MDAATTSASGESSRDGEEWDGVERLLFLARTHLGMDVAWLSQFSDGQQVIRAASGETDAMSVAVGEGTPLEGSYCTRVLAGTIPAVISDARRHPVTRELAITKFHRIGSYVGVPWRGTAGETAGMLCCLSRGPDPALDERAVTFLALIADLISDHVTSPLVSERRANQRGVEHVHQLLEKRALRMVFQPVVRLHDGEPQTLEALARFDDPAFPTPAHAFATATRVGLGVPLELLAVQQAFAHLDDIPAGIWLAVNLSADSLMIPVVQDTLLERADRRIAVEVTEHTQVSDYQKLSTATDRLRSAGIQIVVDDAGAGFASLRHILKLRPDVIKLDIEITRDVDIDPVRMALTRSLVTFAHDVGAALIAEGIETRGERDMLMSLGVRLGQGYLMARPGPLRPHTTHEEHRLTRVPR
jgi:EAL domain-containing protein (putative c-di-GMP-specific phosphodiesterase class I)